MTAPQHPSLRDKYGYVWRWETVGDRTGYRWHHPNGDRSSGVGWETRAGLESVLGRCGEWPEEPGSLADLPWSQHILEREDPERLGARRRSAVPTGATYVRCVDGWHVADDAGIVNTFRGANIAVLDAHPYVTGPTVEIQ